MYAFSADSPNVGRATITLNQPKSGRFCADDAHGEEDQPLLICYSQLKVAGVPEVFSGIAQQSAGVSYGFALGGMDAGEVMTLVILHVPLGGMVRVEEVARH